MRRLVILGSGGLARQIVALVEDLNHNRPEYDLLGFLSKDVGTVDGYPVLGDDDRLASLDAAYAVGIEDAAERRRLDLLAGDVGCKPATLIHPTARMDRRARVGEGAIIFEGASVVYGAEIGRHVIMNLNSVASHDCRIGDFVELTTNSIVGARTQVGDEVMLGMGAIVLNGLAVGRRAVVGAGAVVTKDVSPDTCVVGAPAKPINHRSTSAGRTS